MPNFFKNIISYNNSYSKNVNYGFSLKKYTNTTPLTNATVFSGSLSGRGSLKRIYDFNKNHSVTTTVNTPSNTSLTTYNIINWNEINPNTFKFGNWISIATSSSGQYVYATDTNFFNPSIWTSNNYGETFTQITNINAFDPYGNLSVNYNGNFVVCPAIRDSIFYSNNYGNDVQPTSDPGGFWWVSAINSTGSICCIGKSFNNGGVTNPIFISNNQSLFSPILNGLYCNWSGITMNSSGNFIIACSYEGYVYYTKNTGNSWSLFSLPKYNWSSVSTSSNGNYICVSSFDGYIYVSINGGTSWTSCSPNNTSWSSVYIARSSNLILACGITDYIYYSSNYGLTWNITSPNSTPSNWSSICCSDDGSYIYACINGGNIYTTTTSKN